MCKVITLTNSSKIKNLEKFINTVRPIITASEPDGFGWATMGVNGVFGERSTSVKKSTRIAKQRKQVTLPVTKQTFQSFGKVTKQHGPMLVHGRISTNDHTLINTHPLQKHGWTLIHNGVVTNHGPEYVMNTTNDTEHLIELLATKGIDALVDSLTGYYAFAAIDNEGQLHVCRDAIAQLKIAFIEELDSYIFATTAKLIEDLCKEMKYANCSFIEDVEDNIYMIFKGNELVHRQNIKSRGYQKREADLMHKSVSYLDNVSALSSLNEVSDDKVIDKYMDFFEEISRIDSSYEVWDKQDNQMAIYEFMKLDKIEQLQCYILRPDGTYLDPEDTNNISYGMYK